MYFSLLGMFKDATMEHVVLSVKKSKVIGTKYMLEKLVRVRHSIFFIDKYNYNSFLEQNKIQMSDKTNFWHIIFIIFQRHMFLLIN